MAFHDSPGPVSPMWSMARYSLGVKQSCTSIPVDVVERQPRATQRVEDRGPHMRQQVRIVGGPVQFLSQAQSDGAMPPAVDAPDRACSGMVAQIAVADQHQSRTAIGHLAAVEAPQPALR